MNTATQTRKFEEPTSAQGSSACLSYRHDFGLLSEAEAVIVKSEAKEWLRAWQKEGVGSDRNEVIERCAQVVDQANREGPYEAIASAKRIRALKAAPSLPTQPAREEVREALEAETSRADENSISCMAFVNVLRNIVRNSPDAYAVALAEEALKMPWASTEEAPSTAGGLGKSEHPHAPGSSTELLSPHNDRDTP